MIYSDKMIRDASPGDASLILSLNKSCFPENYLIFSVYQSDKSALHLEKIIRKETGFDHSEIIRVLSDQNSILGYYLAKPVDDGFFLNYIVTKKGYERKNIGGLLLEDFHRLGKSLGYSFYQLDVYASNEVAIKWYIRNGYNEIGESYNLCFHHSVIKKPSQVVDPLFAKKDLKKILDEEAEFGFSKIKLDGTYFYFEIMLIVNDILRFQNLKNITVDKVLDYLPIPSLGTREYLLFTGQPKYHGKRKLLFEEKVFRMIKNIE